MILKETSDIIDIQLIDKGVVNTWNSGRAVTGIINTTGAIAFTPAGRNTGSWTAHHEAWRFKPDYQSIYNYTNCDLGNDGVETFNLQVAQNDLLASNPTEINFYLTMADAQAQVNSLPLNYVNTSNPQIIYSSGNGQIKQILLSTVNCATDFDTDGVSTPIEDTNNDSNLANDDTDGDGIPNFHDNDDDGDMILTSEEYVIANKNATAFLDTDADTILNYLDNDDDGDGILTYKEDYNNNGYATDDDTNNNTIPDYLEASVALGMSNFDKNDLIQLYPNPAYDVLNINNESDEEISKVAILSINGSVIKEFKIDSYRVTLPVSDLQSGIYFVKITIGDKVQNSKFIKE